MQERPQAPSAMPKKSKAPPEPVEKVSQSRAAQAGIVLSISRTDKRLRRSGIAKRVGGDSAVYATALVEHILKLVLKGAGEEAQFESKQVEGKPSSGKRVSTNHVVAAVQSNPDLARLFASFVFPSSIEIPKATTHVLSKQELQIRQQKMEEAKANKEASKKAVAQADPTD